MKISGSFWRTSSTLEAIQHKKVIRLWTSARSHIKWNLTNCFIWKIDFNLFDYPLVTRWLIKEFYFPGIFFGLGVHSYYSFDFSKKFKLTTKNFHKLKLNIKKDSWFFYGLAISWRLNFLSSTIKIWNVFYNQIIEKTFPIFSIRNTLVGEINSKRLEHFLTFFLKNKWWKKKFFSLWNHPRMISWIVLLD